MKKRILSLILVGVMVLSLAPMALVAPGDAVIFNKEQVLKEILPV